MSDYVTHPWEQEDEAHKILIVEKDAEIERLKACMAQFESWRLEEKAEADQLITELADWAINDSQIVSGCRDDYERGRYDALREVIDRIQRAKEATK